MLFVSIVPVPVVFRGGFRTMFALALDPALRVLPRRPLHAATRVTGRAARVRTGAGPECIGSIGAFHPVAFAVPPHRRDRAGSMKAVTRGETRFSSERRSTAVKLGATRCMMLRTLAAAFEARAVRSPCVALERTFAAEVRPWPARAEFVFVMETAQPLGALAVARSHVIARRTVLTLFLESLSIFAPVAALFFCAFGSVSGVPFHGWAFAPGFAFRAIVLFVGCASRHS